MILTTRVPGAPEFKFCQPIYMYNLGEIKGFVPEVANSDPHLNFYLRNAVTRAEFTTWHSARDLALRW